MEDDQSPHHLWSENQFQPLPLAPLTENRFLKAPPNQLIMSAVQEQHQEPIELEIESGAKTIFLTISKTKIEIMEE